MNKILIVDDEKMFREDLADLLSLKGFQTQTARNGDEGLKKAIKWHPDIIVSDLVMGEMDGIEMIKRVKEHHLDSFIIIMTAFGTLETSMEGLKLGALDYILKPFSFDLLLKKISLIIDNKTQLHEIQLLREKLHKAEMNLSTIVFGSSKVMKNISDTAERLSNVNATVLLLGESGTGKEVYSRYIHQQGSRCNEPFVAINCAAIPENLLESQCFGHIKGSYTGAESDHIGYFESAGAGTLLLDEVSEMSFNLQSKLLRAIEEREYTRIGDTSPRPFHARIIATTNKNLADAIKDGTFREDLYYRLSVVEITLPPLKERIEDIPIFAEHFMNICSKEQSKPLEKISEMMMAYLCNQKWPGNIRQLKNFIERAVILSSGLVLDLPDDSAASKETKSASNKNSYNFKAAQEDFEKNFITKVWLMANKNKEETARLLEINASTLYRKISNLGLTL